MKTSEVLGSLPLNPTYVAKFLSYSTTEQCDAWVKFIYTEFEGQLLKIELQQKRLDAWN